MTKYKKYLISNLTHRQPIYNYLKSMGHSENFLKNLRKAVGYIKLNGKDVYINEYLKNGDELEIYTNPNTKSTITSCIIPLDIVYEDDFILIVNKPSGLATMPTKSHYLHNLSGAVLNYMQNKIENFVIRVVNRLDKDTAGIVVFAKDSLSCNWLNNACNFKKTYYALCEGELNDCIIDKEIETVSQNGINIRKRKVCKNGKRAKTFVSVIKVVNNISVCKITLEHGRTHQIRVHLSSIGHPLVGDSLYGQSHSEINHAALVCKQIELIHPYHKRQMQFEVLLPSDFEKFLRNKV